MALHPDSIHSGLSKITQFCEEAIDRKQRKEPKNGYFRDFIYLPVLLVSEELYELKHSESNKPELAKVESSIMVYNYHYKSEASMAYVFVVTKKGFSNFISSMLEIEEKIESDMIKMRKGNVA